MFSASRFCDEDLALPIEQHAARRAQRERALVVVLGHLEELLVLQHLERPEADGEGRKADRQAVLQRAQPEMQIGAIVG